MLGKNVKFVKQIREDGFDFFRKFEGTVQSMNNTSATVLVDGKAMVTPITTLSVDGERIVVSAVLADFDARGIL